MGIFQQFPYSNFHEMNLDQIIKIMRQIQDEWKTTKTEWASYKDFIDNYFANLNLDEETEKALRRLIADGTLDPVIDPVIISAVTDWLADHITQPTTPAIDTSLSVAGAAADAKSAGDAITELRSDLESDITLLGDSVFNAHALVTMSPTATSSGWRLKSDGCSAHNDAYFMDKYQVHAGDLLYVDITLDETKTTETNTASFQFQIGSNVPVSSNPNIVGSAYTRSYKGFITVPDTATYLIIGGTANTTNVVKSFLRQQDVFIVTGGAPAGYIKIEGKTFKTNTSIYFYPYPYNGEYYNLNFAGTHFSITCSDNKTLCLDLSKLGHNVLGDSSQAASAFVEVDYGNIPTGYLPILQYRTSNGKPTVFTPWRGYIVNKYSPVSPEITKTNLIAHRGGNTAAENTLANFEGAIANGYTILECDVKFTSDDIPILSHDDTFNVGGVTYIISQMTWAQIQAVDSSKMLLSDFIKLCKRENVVGEIDCATFDNSNYLEIISDLVTSLGMNGRCYIAVTATGARNLLNVRTNHIISVAGMTSSGAVSGIADIVQKSNLCICSTRYDYVTADLIETIHNAGCISKTYTVDTPSIVDDMLTAGVDLIITNSYRPSNL